ncbi:hypothetical protein GCM10010381_58290 [Streptomyces xantholiticus]|nr:hypothetical protein GCM10010381_58290 [Streptomyces xantholiticus]
MVESLTRHSGERGDDGGVLRLDDRLRHAPVGGPVLLTSDTHGGGRGDQEGDGGNTVTACAGQEFGSVGVLGAGRVDHGREPSGEAGLED